MPKYVTFVLLPISILTTDFPLTLPSSLGRMLKESAGCPQRPCCFKLGLQFCSIEAALITMYIFSASVCNIKHILEIQNSRKNKGMQTQKILFHSTHSTHPTRRNNTTKPQLQNQCEKFKYNPQYNHSIAV